MVRFDERKENEILAHEAGRRRDAGEREHEDEQQNGSGGAAIIKAVQVFEFLANESFLVKDDNHGEGARGHEHIGEQVVGDSRRSGFRQSSGGFVPRKEAEENVAHVRDGGIRQEALHIGLRQRGEVAPGERSNGDASDEINPRLVRWRENRSEQSQEQRKTCGLRSHADISRDRRRRTFVNVRRPLMEGYGCDFEEQADGNQDKGSGGEKGGMIEQRRFEMERGWIAHFKNLASLAHHNAWLPAHLDDFSQRTPLVEGRLNVSRVRRSRQTVDY